MRALVFVWTLLVAVALPPIAVAEARVAPLRIVLDPGHGGEKHGAVGPGAVREKDVALAISLAVEAELQRRGHEVILTRWTDLALGLAARVDVANEKAADLFVSIHANSMPTREARARAHGVETYFLSADASDEAAAALAHAENADDGVAGGDVAGDALGKILADLARSEAHAHSSRLAYAIHQALVVGTGARDRGVRQAPFVVLEGARMPAVLLEVGYISHPGEAKRLVDPEYQSRIAGAIASGIGSFLQVVGQPGGSTQVPGLAGGAMANQGADRDSRRTPAAPAAQEPHHRGDTGRLPVPPQAGIE